MSNIETTNPSLELDRNESEPMGPSEPRRTRSLTVQVLSQVEERYGNDAAASYFVESIYEWLPREE